MSQILFRRAVAAAAILALPWITAGATAQEVRVPASAATVKLSFAPVVKQATPAVVNVYVRRLVRQRASPFFDDPFFRQFLGREFGLGVPRERVQRSLGSGVIVTPDGVVVTNHHVIKGRGEAEIKIVLADKREFAAEIILKDERTDLAVLRIDASRVAFPYLPFQDSDTLEVGDLVLAIGNPFGIGQTVTSGIVSALARTSVGVSDFQSFIQTDAAINPGNSGGALVDTKGRLVGINTAIYSRTGGSHGIGFAIPSEMVRLVVQSALRGGTVKRPWLGAKLQAVTAEISEAFGLDRPAGALVGTVTPRSPAARAGLRTSDLIIAIDGHVVEDPSVFNYRFATRPLGGQAQVDVLRGGRRMQLAVALESAPAFPRDERVIQGPSPFRGAKVANLSPALAEELRLDATTSGVVIMDVERRSVARRVGLKKGDVVVTVNGEKIRRTRDLDRAAGRPSRLWRITIKRNGQTVSVTFAG